MNSFHPAEPRTFDPCRVGFLQLIPIHSHIEYDQEGANCSHASIKDVACQRFLEIASNPIAKRLICSTSRYVIASDESLQKQRLGSCDSGGVATTIASAIVIVIAILRCAHCAVELCPFKIGDDLHSDMEWTT